MVGNGSLWSPGEVRPNEEPPGKTGSGPDALIDDGGGGGTDNVKGGEGPGKQRGEGNRWGRAGYLSGLASPLHPHHQPGPPRESPPRPGPRPPISPLPHPGGRGPLRPLGLPRGKRETWCQLFFPLAFSGSPAPRRMCQVQGGGWPHGEAGRHVPGESAVDSIWRCAAAPQAEHDLSYPILSELQRGGDEGVRGAGTTTCSGWKGGAKPFGLRGGPERGDQSSTSWMSEDAGNPCGTSRAVREVTGDRCRRLSAGYPGTGVRADTLPHPTLGRNRRRVSPSCSTMAKAQSSPGGARAVIEAELHIPAAHLVGQRDGDPKSRCAEGVPDGHRSPIT